MCFSGKIQMVCNRLAAAVFSSNPEMDERKAPSMQVLLPFTNCQKCRMKKWDGYFQTNRSAMKHAEKPLVSKKRSKSKEAPCVVLEKYRWQATG
ncbi:hypothetical protein T12_11675 [Trichinella patagoniensis]|uniref:Uncharacterized protein n=1 Tax=Trichinella patagoniensis TaxID=990121 RepID=A0A0V0YX98_9BILA|nr:hypothetical protein T12_11675 [Trichinella patagoniensis]